MLGEKLRLGPRDLGERLFQLGRAGSVQPATLRIEQAFVRGVPHQGVLEFIAALAGAADGADHVVRQQKGQVAFQRLRSQA